MGRRSSIGARAIFCSLVFAAGSARSQIVAPAAAHGSAEVLRQDEELSLSYRVSDGCPDHAAFIASFEQRLNEPSLRVTPSAGVIDVSVHKEGNQYRASLSILLQGGEVLTRSIEASTCDQAVDAIAFVLAVALDPKSPEAIVVQQSPTADQGAPGADDAPRQPASSAGPSGQASENEKDSKGHSSAKPARARRSSTPAVERRRDFFVRLFAGPALVAGALPQNAFGGQLSVEVGVTGGGFWSPSLRWGVSIFAPVTVEHTLGDARFQFWTTQTELCPTELSWGRLDVRPCGQVSLGQTSAEGSDTFEPNAVHRLWFSLGISGRLGLALHRHVRISVGGSLEFPVIRDGYHFDESILYQTPPIAGSWSAGMELQFW